MVSCGGVGFDISCGVRTLHTGLTLEQLRPHQKALADLLASIIPAGLEAGSIKLTHRRWTGCSAAARPGRCGRATYEADLARTEEHGCMAGANPSDVSERPGASAPRNGHLGSGNHYLEVQLVARVSRCRSGCGFDL